QPGQRAPDHHGVRPHARGELLRRHRGVGPLGEVREHVEGDGKSVAPFHVTNNVTIMSPRQGPRREGSADTSRVRGRSRGGRPPPPGAGPTTSAGRTRRGGTRASRGGAPGRASPSPLPGRR